MKVLLVCALVVAGAFIVKANHELCALNDDQISELVKCMGDHLSAEIKGKARELIQKHGNNVAEILKKQCDANVDFAEKLKSIATPEEAEAVKKAYGECKQG
uniref:Putative antimicrobial peptide microplusin n=1 Tax=Amblyomma cajennense TaxID=34607 RepID=A0A023FSR6_AMBCJ